MKHLSKLFRKKNPIVSLESYRLDNTPKFTFQSDEKVPCKVINVYDGDTLDIAMEYGGSVYAFRIRLAGIDTPELKPNKDIENREEIIAQGVCAKEFLEKMVLDKILPIQITGQEKYGRLLGKLYIDNATNVTINDILIMSGHAVAYDGGKKTIITPSVLE